jgi:hypothetical protein
MWQPRKIHRKQEIDSAFGVDKGKIKPFTEENRGKNSD